MMGELITWDWRTEDSWFNWLGTNSGFLSPKSDSFIQLNGPALAWLEAHTKSVTGPMLKYQNQVRSEPELVIASVSRI